MLTYIPVRLTLGKVKVERVPYLVLVNRPCGKLEDWKRVDQDFNLPARCAVSLAADGNLHWFFLIILGCARDGEISQVSGKRFALLFLSLHGSSGGAVHDGFESRKMTSL